MGGGEETFLSATGGTAGSTGAEADGLPRSCSDNTVPWWQQS